MNKLPFLFVIILLSCFSCKVDPKEDATNVGVDRENIVRLHFLSEPDKLNPIVSRSGYATRIHDLIFQTLIEADPHTLELKPMLANALPVEAPVTEGKYKGGYSYSYEIHKEAVWENGSPITGHDYAFTMKMVYNPQVNAAVWRGVLGFIKDVIVDESNPKKFTIYTDEFYMAAGYATGGFYIFPQYRYDPDGIMSNYNLADLSDPKKSDALAKSDEQLKVFADQIHSTKFTHDVENIGGSGPYTITEWKSGEYLKLVKKENWWGTKLAEEFPMLRAYPTQFIIEPMKDIATAATKLKDQGFDAMSEVSPELFLELKKNELAAKNYNFYAPEAMTNYYFAFNNHNPKLDDKRVRIALTHLLNRDKAVEAVMYGMGKKVDGPIHPTKPYFHKNLKKYNFDIDAAKKLLAEAGWKDTNNDGTLDKIINGERTELSLDIFVTSNPLGKETALIWKEDARKAGVNLEVITKDFKKLLGNELRRREYDICANGFNQSASLDDPYQRWHSDSNKPDGSNVQCFENEEADKLIEAIRSTKDVNERNEKYLRFQEILNEEQPVAFLFAPTERVIIHKKFDTKPTLRRPGYFPNLLKLK